MKAPISAVIGGTTSVNELIKGKTKERVKAIIENELLGNLNDERQEMIFNAKMGSLFIDQDQCKDKYLNSIKNTRTSLIFKRSDCRWI